MERSKTRFGGWKCVLSSEEVEYSRDEFVLGKHIDKWKHHPDGTASLTVNPWNLKRWYTMEMFIEGLGEGMFSTVNVYPSSNGVEIIEKEY